MKKVLFGLAFAAGFVLTASAFAADAAPVDSGAVAPVSAVAPAATGAVAPVATGTVAPAAASGSSNYLSSLDVNGEVKVVSTTATGVTLTWDVVPAATSYVAYYDTKTPDLNDPNAGYANVSDAVGTGTITIGGLKPATKYYLMVVAMDSLGHESNQGSQEVTFTTPATFSFGLSENAVKATSPRNLVLSFNKQLGATQPVSLSIVSTVDKSDLMAVGTLNPVDASKVDVVLGSDVKVGSAYTVTVRLATSVDGENVQAGANAVQEFVVSEFVPAAAGAVAPVAVPTAEAAVPAALPAVDPSVAAVLNAAPVSAEAAKTLPETGPAETLVVVAALLVAGAYVALRRKAA